MRIINYPSIKQFWLNLPTLFDSVQTAFNGKLWQVIQSKFLPYTQGRIIDLACGTGELRRHIQPKDYLGIDINQSYIEHARKRFPSKNINFLVTDATKNLPKKQFDTAFLISAAHHLSNEQLANLCLTVKKSEISTLIIIDDLPIQPFSPLLKFLDAKLGDGKYFRNTSQLMEIVAKEFKIIEQGDFKASLSLYHYPYIIAKCSD